MMVENNLNKLKVKQALIRWALGADDENGATGKVLDMIPWGDKIEKVVPWDDASGSIDSAIGTRYDENSKEWDIGLIMTETSTYVRFEEFISKKVDAIADTYQNFIKQANEAYASR